MARCINCNTEVEGAYCHNCGQKQEISKLTLRSLAEDIQQRLFGLDSRVMRTVRDLTIVPEKVVAGFLNGIRVNYVGPASYYFLLLTLFVLTISLLDIDMAAYTAATTSIFGTPDPEQVQTQMAFQQVAFSNFRVMSFIMIPWYILANYLLFRKSKLNFVESAVFTFYVQAQPMLLSIIGLFLFKYFGLVMAISYVAPLSILYYAYCAVRFYKHNHPVWAFIKGLLVTVLGLFFFVLVALIVMFVALIINPEGVKALLGIQ
ncbi:MAG: DUF3667 domain-containing protein [Bacteroidota bacterium]